MLHKLSAVEQKIGQLKFTILTRVGNGPKQLNGSEAHLLTKDGLPIIPH